MPGCRGTPSGKNKYNISKLDRQKQQRQLNKNIIDYSNSMFVHKIIIFSKGKFCNIYNTLKLNILLGNYHNNNLLPAKSVSSATERVKGLFLGNIIFFRQILHADLQLLLLCSALPLSWKLPGID